MDKPTYRWVTVFAASLSLICPARAAELAGVKLADTMEVGGQSLKLNGMAVGKKFIFKVYVVGLYLPAPAKADKAVVDPDVPKGFVMEFLRSVRRDKLVEAFTQGFEKNAPEKAKKAQTQIERFLTILRDVKKGDRVTLAYAPGKGSTLTLMEERESFEGKDFADAFLLLYVGPKPPRKDVKKGLLGYSYS